MSNQVASPSQFNMWDKVALQVSTSLSSMPNHQNSQSHHYEKRISLAVCLSVGDKFLAQRQYEEASDAFDSAHRFLTAAPSVSNTPNDSISILSSSLASTSSQPLTHIDSYHEDECDVGPRTFNAAIVPDGIMGLDVDTLKLIIIYNQAIVSHAKENYSLAIQLYKFITATICTYVSSGNAGATLTHLAMRAHNNLGQIEYTEGSEEYAQTEFENALAYARHHFNISRMATSYSSKTSSIQINPVTTSSDHQLEIATVLSNWCRTRWMMGCIDQAVFDAVSDILQIRLTNLEVDHPDIAVAHFNLGRLEYSRHSNEKALKHLLQYMRIASSTVKENPNEQDPKTASSGIELDPIQGLVYILQIQNEGKDDDVSTDLIWGLRTLQSKRHELGLIHSDVASVLNYIGTLLFRRRELDYALCFFAQELRVEEQLRSRCRLSKPIDTHEDISISVTCNNIGRILQELGRYAEAKYYYQRSLGEENILLLEKITHVKKEKVVCEANVSDDTIMIDSDEDNTNIALDIPASAMNLYSTVWYNLGLIHDKMGAFKEAIRSFRMSLKLRRAMLGHEHSDVSCLYYNIGVLQMEQKLLDEATESFRQALSYRHVSGKGQLHDLHVIKTLQKLSTMHKAKGNVNGALEAYGDIISVLSTSTDFDQLSSDTKKAIVTREIADLHQAQGNLKLALKHALDSAELFRKVRTSSDNETCAMETDNCSEHGTTSIEEEVSALHLVGSIQHELSEPIHAEKAFAEGAQLIESTLKSHAAHSADPKLAANTLLPLLEVSAILSTPSCAAEA